MKTRWIRTLSLILALLLLCPVLVAESAEKSAKDTAEKVEKKSKKKSSKKSSKGTKKSETKSSKKESSKKSAAAEAESYMLPSAELTLGFLSRDSETEGIGDLLIPVWNPGGTGLLFVNPRGAMTDHDGEEVNLGVGWRQFLPDQNIILGANAYYDYRDTGYSNYDQWGVGIEMLSTWIDARANYYDPSDKMMVVGSYTETQTSQSVSQSAGWSDPYAEDHYILQDYTVTRTLTTVTDTQTYEQYEQALGGYDWEIGLRLPLPIRPETMEARIFGGMYDFDRDFGADASGWKARAEIRLLSTLFLDGGVYENDDLTGSDWFAGARWTVPFDLARVSQGRNPFATAEGRLHGKTRTLQSRLTEMVMRDPQIRLEQSKFMENKALATEETTSTKTTTSAPLLLMPDIQFVDQDSARPGDGTAERPFTAIQAGVDNVYGQQNVYVYDAAAAYEENVVLTEGVNLYGSGTILEFANGALYGSGIAPIVDGVSMGPSITMADDTLVQGFHIRNTDRGGAAQLVSLPNAAPIDISRVGIYGNGATDLTVRDNLIEGASHGALFGRTGDFELLFANNIVRDNDETGLEVHAMGASGTFQVTVEGSRFLNNLEAGAFIDGQNYDESMVEVRNSVFDNNDYGLYINQEDSLLAMSVVDGVQANENVNGGIGVSQENNLLSLANISASTANNNMGDGIYLHQNSLLASVGVLGMPEGLGASVDELTAGFGLTLPPEVATFLSASGAISANNNSGNGVQTIIQAPDGLALAALFDITANINGGQGIQANTESANGVAATIGGSSQNWAETLELLDNVLDTGFGIDLPLSITGGGQMQAIGNTGTGVNLTTVAEYASITAMMGIEATGNGAFGVIAQNVADDLALTSLARVEATDNTFGGIGMTTMGADIGAIGLLADVNASDNMGTGIQSLTLSPNGFAALLTLSTDAIRPLGDLLGVDVPGSAFGQVAANNNFGHGIQAQISGTDAAIAVLLDTQTSGNAANGMNLNLDSMDGTSLAAVLSSDLIYDLAGELVGTPIPYDPIGPVTASGNGGTGILIGQGAWDDAVLLLGGIEAIGNSQGGIVGNQNANNGDAIAVIADTITHGNMGAPGINLTLSSQFGDTLSGLIEVDAHGNNGPGIQVMQNSALGDAFALLAGVDANANNGPGMSYTLTAEGEAAALATYSHAYNNIAAGADFSLTGNQGAALYMGGGLLGMAGINPTIDGLLGIFSNMIPQGAVAFADNTGNGLNATLDGGTSGNVLLGLNGVDAVNNALGMEITLTAVNGSILADLNNVAASINADRGVRITASGAGGTFALAVTDSAFTGNAGNGLTITENYTGPVEIFGEYLAIIGNGVNGLRINSNGTGLRTYDFGGGLLGSVGQSSIFGNVNRDVREAGAGHIVAENNWWGTDTPVAGQFQGSVDYTPWLLAPPAIP